MVQPYLFYCYSPGAMGKQFGWMRRDGEESVEGQAEYDEGMMVIWYVKSMVLQLLTRLN